MARDGIHCCRRATEDRPPHRPPGHRSCSPQPRPRPDSSQGLETIQGSSRSSGRPRSLRGPDGALGPLRAGQARAREQGALLEDGQAAPRAGAGLRAQHGVDPRVRCPRRRDPVDPQGGRVRLLDEEEAEGRGAERLKASAATVYALCESGRLAFVRISTHAIRIAEADLAAYLGGQRLQSAPTRRAGPSQ